MANEILKEERERQARALIEGGGPPPNELVRKKYSNAGGKYSRLVDSVFSNKNSTLDWAPLPPFPEGIHPDSVIRNQDGEAWKSKITCVDVSLNGDGNHRHLSVKEVSRLYSAMAYANRKGMVFNAHITIAWGLLGLGHVDHNEVANALKTFCKNMLSWARDHGLSPAKSKIAYVYAYEASDKLGIHTHVLVSVPQALCEKLRSWAPKGVRGISKVQDIPVEAVHVTHGKRRKPHIGEQWRWFSYLCKGIDPLATVKTKSNQRILASWLLHHKLNAPGEVRCRKMIGVSSNIAESAQKADGFVSSWQRGLFDVRILYSGDEYRQWQLEQEELAVAANRQTVGDYIESFSSIS